MGSLEGRRRAVHDAQKEERRQAILEQAWQLFLERGYEALTMSEIATATGLAKGTLFLYFKTKETLFLTLVEQQLDIFFAQLNTRLQEARSTATIAGVARLICDVLVTHPGLTRLLSIVHTILEQHIPLDAALHFKRMLLQHFQQTGSLLEGILPFLPAGEGAHVLLQAYALALGVWQISDPAPIVRQVLDNQPELRAFDVQFAPEFTVALQALLSGLEQAARRAD
ncbi:TetR family transcriptional regulator [Dictyobacter sp. S3.2.2.5]|uniref:TetR family transcriptional regulator n=1 Tax=Dictyobacter halimunensis TaxID=3026934 RepID=A0ABQ6FZ41_9CHLR|nr:TetR family transcriptional regulator [Dictyobacter sp. S3.2.2.5]